jgi:hypothetical protein
MPPRPQAGTIGNWTEADLAKYIRESIERLLPTHIPSLVVDDLIVAGSLNVATSTVDFHRQLVVVGTSGAPPFTNGWQNFGGGNTPAAYWKDENDLVFLEGTIKSGTLGVAAFPLPPGYRPSQDRFFAVQSNGTIGLVKVGADGNVSPLATGTASNASYSLDGIVFRTGKT